MKYLIIVKKILLKYQMGAEAARADGGVLVCHEVQCFKISLMGFINDRTLILKSGVRKKNKSSDHIIRAIL